MSGKSYPYEFKIEAVKQVVERGHSVADVAKRLEITTHNLYAWVNKFGLDSNMHKDLFEAQAEITRLQKELKRKSTQPEKMLLAIYSITSNCFITANAKMVPIICFHQ